MSFSSGASRSSGEQPTHFQLTQYGSLNLPLPATHWAPWRWAYLRRKGENTMHSKTKRYHKHRVMKNEERGPLRAPKQTKRKVRDVTCTRVQVHVKKLARGRKYVHAATPERERRTFILLLQRGRRAHNTLAQARVMF